MQCVLFCLCTRTYYAFICVDCTDTFTHIIQRISVQPARDNNNATPIMPRSEEQQILNTVCLLISTLTTIYITCRDG